MMDIQEYEEAMQALQERFKHDKNALIKKYALANNPYNIGDIIRDQYHSIKIDKITIALEAISRLPICVYEGIKYTKKGQPAKSGGRHTIYQTNIV